MHDNYVSRAKVVALALWLAAAMIGALVWLLAMIEVPLRYENALILTDVAVLAIAGVWQIRLFTMRLCVLIRTTAGLERERSPELHSVDC